MKVTATREEKQTQIIHAAIKVFSKYGIDGTKMELVAKEAGIGKGTIYEYFASKESLLEKMIQFSVETYRLGLKENITQGSNIEEKLLNCTRYNIEFFHMHLDMLRMAMQVNALSPAMREYMIAECKGIFDFYQDMLQEAKVKGELHKELNIELAVYLINGTIDQFVKQKVFCQSYLPTQINYPELVDIMLKGLRGS